MSELLLCDAASVAADELAEFKDFACELALTAGVVIRPFFRSQLNVEDKSDGSGSGRGFDPVTLADRQAELAMRALIEARYPEHGIYGEEQGLKATAKGLTWVLDPIDGTRAFITGMLHWGVLVALFDGQKPIIGVLYQPITDELFIGDGNVAYLRQHGQARRMRTRSINSLSDAVLCTTDPNLFQAPGELAAFNALAGVVKMRRFGGDCYLYALLAMGQIDLCVETSLQPYDVQALMPIVEGAGGRITSWSGGSPVLGGTLIAAGDAKIHAAALAYLYTGSLPV